MIIGVEKAIRLEGNRIPASVISVISKPKMSESERPGLSLLQIWTPPSKPTIQKEFSSGYWNTGITGGWFQLFELNGDLIYAKPKVTRRGNATLYHPERRIQAGRKLDVKCQYNELHRLGNILSFNAKVNYETNEYSLASADSCYDTRRSDLKLSMLINPLTTSIGSFTGYTTFGGWTYSSKSKLTGSNTQINVKHNLELYEGALETTLFYSVESNDIDNESLMLGYLTTSYCLSPYPDLLFSAGGTIYTGQSADGQPRSGVAPQIKIEGNLPVGGILSLSFNPTVRFFSSQNTLRQSPVLDPTARVYISEEIFNLTFAYRRYFGSDLEATAALFWNDTRHTMFTVPVYSGGWIPVSRRLERLGLKINFDYNIISDASIHLHTQFLQARTSGTGSGDRAPQIPQTTIGLFGTIPHKTLTFRTGLTFESSAPIDFTGYYNNRPERLIWNCSVQQLFNRVITMEMGIKNILNAEYYDFPRYEQMPLTVYLNLVYRGNW